MSYKCLLFCPDDRTARLVTQVLNELEFSVTLSTDPFATVKKLAEEHFDGLVVDIQNEQDAALLFKSARNSSLNHSSLAVAVVEGQTGVAKAFRIGANLVLTKPINVEQSKSTLRVARGLLRKNEAKPASAATPAPRSATQSPANTGGVSPTSMLVPAPSAVMTSEAFSAATTSVPSPAASAAGFSLLETEQEPTPAPEPTEVAFLESMPDPSAGKPAIAEASQMSALPNSAEPIAASTAGAGAGAAAAPARSKPGAELKFSPPLATQETIVADNPIADRFEPASAPIPTFSSYGQESSASGGGTKIFKNVAVLLLMGAAGYMAWQRLQLGQYVPGAKGTLHQSSPQSGKAVGSGPASKSSIAPVSAVPAPIFDNDSAGTPANTATEPTAAPSSALTDTTHKSQLETIRIEEMPVPPEPKITVVAKPLVVKNNSGNSVGQSLVQPPPPSLTIPSSSASDNALAKIVATNVIPQPAPRTLRVSQGVSQGLLMKKVAPSYPPMALQLRKQGPVELMATVSKEGAITGIKVVGGDAMLAKAAADAVSQWKYRPYLLNGEPVEIETQITVNFRLPN
jgi:periplasmic protein TonB